MSYTIKDINNALIDSVFEDTYKKKSFDYDEFLAHAEGEYGLDVPDEANIEEIVASMNDELQYFIVKLPNGDTMKFYSDPTGSHYDGAEIGIIVELSSGQLFKMSGYYSSWDSDSYDGVLYEVEKVIEIVEVTRFPRVNS